MNNRTWPLLTPSSCASTTLLPNSWPIWILIGTTSAFTRRRGASWSLRCSTLLTTNGCRSSSGVTRCKSSACSRSSTDSARITTKTSTRPSWTSSPRLPSASVTLWSKEKWSKCSTLITVHTHILTIGVLVSSTTSARRKPTSCCVTISSSLKLCTLLETWTSSLSAWPLSLSKSSTITSPRRLFQNKSQLMQRKFSNNRFVAGD